MSRADFLPYKIYLYLSADGIFRQRCGRHVETAGPLRATAKFRSADPGGRWGCIMCGWEKHHADEERALSQELE